MPDTNDDERMGQFIRPGNGSSDDEAEEVAQLLRDDGQPLYGADRDEVVPAEEAAMHLTDPPEMHDTDGYFD